MSRIARQLAFWIVATCSFGVSALSPRAYAAPPTSPAEMQADAELHDIFFHGDQTGWAVGDRGLILSTRDGGNHWVEQTAHQQATLQSVSFVDAKRGWIVGGYVEPYQHTSRAVVLKTEDGGLRWTPLPANALPALKRVRMLDAQNGWAVGDSSPLFPSGVFKTKDGGRSWATVPVGRAQGLLTGDFVSAGRGVIAGENGQLQIVLGNESIETRTPDLGQRPLRCLRMLDITRGWLVGADGLILTTRDGGVSWQQTARNVPVEGFDFGACATRGSHVWVAGEPGTFVYHSADEGRTWSKTRTGIQTPIRALHFSSSRTGWAVGALGVVLHTKDGGQNWSVQRQGGERLAIWMVSPGSTAPIEALAGVSGGDGYFSRLTVLFPESPSSAFTASANDRTHEAAAFVGGAGGNAAWQFFMDDYGLVNNANAALARIDRFDDGDGRRALQAYLVQQIRQWRPTVVVAASPPGSPFAPVILEQLQLAVSDAADATRFTEQISIQGLSSHRVARLFTQTENGSIKIQNSRLLTTIGMSAGSYASHSRGLLNQEFDPAAETVNLSAVQSGSHTRGLFDGLSGLGHGQGARRVPGPPLVANLAQLQRMIQQTRNVRALLSSKSATAKGQSTQPLLVSQLDDLTAGVNSRSAAEITFQLAQALRNAGNLRPAADAFDRILQKYPDSPHADAAAIWLLQYYASQELRRREHENSGMVAGQGKIRIKGPAKSVLGGGFSIRDPQVKQAGFQGDVDLQPATIRAAASDLDRRRAERAMAYAQLIQRTRPTLYEDPRLRFSVAAAQRALGRLRPADGFYRRFSDADSPPGWRESAAAELWLPHKQGRPPKTLQPCFRTAQKPTLDGRLDDRLWQTAQAIDLKSSSGDSATDLATRVWVAYDLEHLYLAAVCQTRETPPGDAGPRQRDADLGKHDRIQFFLDINRDYSSYYRLEVDDRGWGADACFRDKTWNPRWHIAHQSLNRVWIVEAAIPFSELTDQMPVEEQVWAFGVQRVTPNAALQSWTKPAAIEPRPEGFGLISFDLER